MATNLPANLIIKKPNRITGQIELLVMRKPAGVRGMFNNIFKIKIPKDHAQEVTELESWTVQWHIKTGWGDNVAKYHKSFIDEKEAKEFRKQLKESAGFIKAYIYTDMYKN